MPTDTSEKGLENIIEACLLDSNAERSEASRWLSRKSTDFNKEFCLDEGMLREFLEKTQSEKANRARIYTTQNDTRRFYGRVRDQISQRGIVDVLRRGVEHNATNFDLYYPFPIKANEEAQKEYDSNRWTVVRQLHYSQTRAPCSVDIVLMLNGLPIITMELKNELSCQNCDDAVRQYRKDRAPRELLFKPKRCAVHFAVDDAEVKMCTKLCGEESWFLPFNKGVNDGAGNPVNPQGLKTSYLWEDILQKPRLSEIVENFANVITKKNNRTQRTEEDIIWPRYHQLEVVRELLADTKRNDIGQRYLIQHSAGSGKSNSITWLAFQLVNQKNEDGITPRFESVIVITDRVNLDKQIRDNIRAFCNNKSIVDWADDSATLRSALSSGKKIIISTIYKFPFILRALGREMGEKQFCVIIDEAHSGQSGSMQSALNSVLSGYGQRGVKVEDTEDGLNALLSQVIEGRQMATNVNFYAFTATPKNKTLEMFGTPYKGEDGETSHKPFHLYSMRQAIEEGFIRDVLENYTTYDSFYKILKATEKNPEFDKNQASRELRRWVESQPETVEKKARIMVEHFHETVCHKMKGEARAMIICNGISRAIDYYNEVQKQLENRKSPYKAIVAFSGTKEYAGKQVGEADLNGFPSAQIEKTFREGSYRFLIVADKFQTGYDEPLLHTMYVDKALSGVKTVQTLSRLNRCHRLKTETYVLDFANKAEGIQEDFQRYYKKTILSRETDINMLSDNLADCDKSGVYEPDDVENFNKEFWANNSEREKLDPILDTCVERFNKLADEDRQGKVKSSMKQFVRLYEFLSALRNIGRVDWEKKNIFFHFLIKKLPILKQEDRTEGLLELVDFDKYRLVKKADKEIKMENENATLDPVSAGQAGGTQEPDMETLERIVDDFNQAFGNIEWHNPDMVRNQIRQVVSKLQANDEVRDSVLNNEVDVQEQVIHKNVSQELGIVTRDCNEMHQRYLLQPEIQVQLDNLILMRLQEQIRPTFSEQLLTEKLLEEFEKDFKELCGTHYCQLEEVIEWLFKVFDAETIRTLDGIKKIKHKLNLIYRAHGRTEDLQDWLKQLIDSFEAFMKKIYYMTNGRELTKEGGGFAQFLDAAKAVGVNRLHYTTDEKLSDMKSSYEFVHRQRNEHAHNAPIIDDSSVRPGIHMTAAMYLYATMINIANMERAETAAEKSDFKKSPEAHLFSK